MQFAGAAGAVAERDPQQLVGLAPQRDRRSGGVGRTGDRQRTGGSVRQPDFGIAGDTIRDAPQLERIEPVRRAVGTDGGTIGGTHGEYLLMKQVQRTGVAQGPA